MEPDNDMLYVFITFGFALPNRDFVFICSVLYMCIFLLCCFMYSAVQCNINLHDASSILVCATSSSSSRKAILQASPSKYCRRQ